MPADGYSRQVSTGRDRYLVGMDDEALMRGRVYGPRRPGPRTAAARRPVRPSPGPAVPRGTQGHGPVAHPALGHRARRAAHTPSPRIRPLAQRSTAGRRGLNCSVRRPATGATAPGAAVISRGLVTTGPAGSPRQVGAALHAPSCVPRAGTASWGSSGRQRRQRGMPKFCRAPGHVLHPRLGTFTCAPTPHHSPQPGCTERGFENRLQLHSCPGARELTRFEGVEDETLVGPFGDDVDQDGAVVREA
ncbi:hypothetical protein P3T29_000004 [Kitasatospora sp. MAP5-34]|nr:hypothetical protein [Kitasatospora sp. MAP5-34]